MPYLSITIVAHALRALEFSEHAARALIAQTLRIIQQWRKSVIHTHVSSSVVEVETLSIRELS